MYAYAPSNVVACMPFEGDALNLVHSHSHAQLVKDANYIYVKAQ